MRELPSETGGNGDFETVGETGPFLPECPPHLGEAPQCLVGEGTEGEQHAGVCQNRQLGAEVRGTGITLERGRLVGRWGATYRRGDKGPRQFEPVVSRAAEGLVGIPGPVQGGEEEVARAVAGEHPAGPVPPVGRRGEADDDEPGARVTEARQAASPSTPRRHATPAGSPRLAHARPRAWDNASNGSLRGLSVRGSERPIARAKGYGVGRAVISP